MIGRFKIWFYIRLDSSCNGTKKKLLNWLAMSFGLARNSPLVLRIIFGDSDSLLFKEIIDSIPFHVFLILLMLPLK